MKNKYLIVFFIGIVVLISILFIEQSVNKQDESTFAEEIVFRDFFSVLETQKIVIKWDSNSVLLERRDDGWYTGDGVVSYKADNSLIESIFSNLVKVKKTDVASNNPENYSNFGVDDSSGIFVELKKSDTETVSKFWIGNTTGSNATYFRMDGVSEVWLVSPSIRDFVRKTAGDFRDKKIIWE